MHRFVVSGFGLLLGAAACGPKMPVPPEAPSWMESQVAQQIQQRYPDAAPVSPIFKGVAHQEDDFTEWDVDLKRGYCYYFSGVADTQTAEELYIQLEDPSGDRVERMEEDEPPQVIMHYCPEIDGMFKVMAKITDGRGHFQVGVFAKAAAQAPPPPPPPPAPAPAPTQDLERVITDMAASAAPGAEQVGNFFEGSADKTDWFVALEPGKCYWFIGAGVDSVDELYLYLWNPENSRMGENKSETNRVTLGHCPKTGGMYKFQAKVDSGEGRYKVGVYSKAQ